MYALWFLVLNVIISYSQAQIRAAFRDFQYFLNPDTIRGTDKLLPEYDFVIIGAGSGGSVVANRLSENPNWTVLLLEAGEDEIFLTDVPLTASLQSITAYNWGYKSERQKTACLGLIDGRCNLPRGKALGGTSVLNFLIYTRGNKRDFNEWAALGNEGWSYEDVLPYFIKSENCSLCEGIDDEFHGKSGYLNIEQPGYESPIVQRFLNAGQDLGYKVVDINGRNGLGFSKVLATMKRGTRCSASKAFLKPIKKRKNLHISIRSRVTKILIDPKNKRAYGVEFLKNLKMMTIYAKKEIILSAGTFNSPQILMLSGIGPAEDLYRLKIPVVQNLRVGYNLQDHMAMSTLAFFVNESITISDRRVQNPLDILNYLFNGRGPYTVPGGAEALAFIQTKYQKNELDYPDIELVLGAGAINGDHYGSLRNLLGIPQSLYDKVYKIYQNTPAFSIVPVLMRPRSRGRVLIKDKNPLHWPIVITNYFQDDQDVAVMVEGIKMAIAISKSSHLRQLSATLNPTSFPGCEHLHFGSDRYWGCALRHVATTLGHQVGTCKMGPFNDPNAVVDSQLKVYGVSGLRVVDGSVMPNVVAGHTNAVIMMIGEKASDLIKNTWR